MSILRDRIIQTSVCLTLILCPACFADAQDIVTISSDKTAVVDKSKGTAIWERNVQVIRQKDASSLLSDRLTVVRNAATGRIMMAEAEGNVRGAYYQSEELPPQADATADTGRKSLHTRFVCNTLTFNRKSALGILKGNVQIWSKEFEITAEHVQYQYLREKGTITAKENEQVGFVFYGKHDPQTIAADREKQKIVRQVTGVADEIRFDRSVGKAVLQGKVHVTDHVDQSQFRSDRAELFFNDLEEIETVVADGNFSMNQPRRFSRADRAMLEYGSEEVTLMGNAYVKDDSNNLEINSARIKMYMKVDKGIISGVDDVPVKMKIEIK